MIAVVTGGGRGIGRAIALDLARRGCDIVLLGRSTGSLAAAAAEVVGTGQKVLALSCDVANSKAVADASARVFAEFGVPSVVVSNAGVVHRASIASMTEEQWDDVVDVNLKGTFLVTRAFLPRMLELKRGRFVAIGSISSTLGTARQSAYCAAKWGTVGFVKSLAEELRGSGLQAMCVMPGAVATDMLKGGDFTAAMQPEDVAKIVTFLALDAPMAMNASSVEVFGP